MRNQIRGMTLMLVMLAGLLLTVGCATKKVIKDSRLDFRETESADNLTQKNTAQTLEALTRSNLSELTSQTLLTAQTIPEDNASLTVQVESLSDLPNGAGYTAKDGRASVGIKRDGDNFIITSKCDSVQRLLMFYERENFRQSEQIDSLKTENTRLAEFERLVNSNQTASAETSTVTIEHPPNYWWVWITIGFVLGFALSNPLKKGINSLIKIVK